MKKIFAPFSRLSHTAGSLFLISGAVCPLISDTGAFFVLRKAFYFLAAACWIFEAVKYSKKKKAGKDNPGRKDSLKG